MTPPNTDYSWGPFPGPQTVGYSRENARACVKASALAYAKFSEAAEYISSIEPGARFIPIENKKTDTQGFVVSNGKVILVAFRGTENWHTALTDCEILPMRISATGPFKVHSGFWRAADSVSDAVVSAIHELRAGAMRDAPVFVCGHSEGGALTRLIVWRLRRESGITAINYTFGEPRSMNRAMALDHDSVLKEWSYRVRHSCDGVCLVPWLGGFYRHGATEIFYDELNVMHVDYPDALRVPTYLLGLWLEYKLHRNVIAPALQHPIKRYEAIYTITPPTLTPAALEGTHP